MSLIKRLAVLFLLALFAGWGGSADALSIVQEPSFVTEDCVEYTAFPHICGDPSHYVNYESHQLDASTDVTIELFDPSLGVLNEVRIGGEVWMSASATSRFYDDADWFWDVPRTAGIQELYDVSVTLDWTLFGIVSFDVPELHITDTCSDTADFLGYDASCRTSFAVGPISIIGVAIDLTDPESLSAFIGLGSSRLVTVAQSGTIYFAETDGDDGSGIDKSGFLKTEGSFFVEYNYVVPEPSTALLLALGLGGLPLLQRRLH